MAEPALQPFRYAGDPSQTSTEFKGVIWKDHTRTTLVYAWTITSRVPGESGKQRKRAAASGLGGLLAALRHHHGPDDTAQLEKEEYQKWHRVLLWPSTTAEQRLAAIKYLEGRLGVANGGSWQDALALQDALQVVSLPDVRHTCSPPPPALLRLLSPAGSPPPALLRPLSSARPSASTFQRFKSLSF